ncbi:MAG: YopX family protein [Staphylococcus haemolyticus]|nr:YopX family protein [Staphylococcus haemolyticus]WAI21017.1 MAG: YopX family protein [Staphylococcus haemolyticus]WAI22183.1 MAG: YopX family protein [Staphylococcus haemolyticus]
MPKIKLRVWDKENKRMLVPGEDSDCITLEIDENGINVYDMQHPSAEKGYDLAHLDSNLLMSTGLKDKNGVEIYEGDIIQHSEKPNPCFSYPFEVIQARTGEWRLDNFRCGTVLAFSNQDELEVLGNIYENPELLEDE